MLDERDNLEWLDAWYRRQCDGLWEHTLGLQLEAVEGRRRTGFAASDNGWRLTIELAGTDGAGSGSRRLALETQDGGWLECSVNSERFTGAGDARRLEAVIGVFRLWAEGAEGPTMVELETAAAGR